MNAIDQQLVTNSPPSGELVTIPSHPATALALFTSDGGKDLDPLLAEVREKIDAWNCPGTDTKKARDEIASFAFKIVRSKTALEKVGKALAAEAKLIPGKIDASRNRIKTTLDQWAAEVRAPLDAWEVAEDARIKRHREHIDTLSSWAVDAPNKNITSIGYCIDKAESIEISPEACEEFEAEYARAKDAALRALRTALTDRERYDAEQAEFARLRAAEAEREAIEAERQRQETAAANLAAAREREARAAVEAVENERRRAELEAQRERRRLELEAEQSRLVAERRERELKAQAAAAERRAVEIEERSQREAAQAVADAKRQEAERIAAEKAEAERRETNKRHAAAVNRKARVALVAGGMEEDAATLAVTLIASRKIPNITISY